MKYLLYTDCHWNQYSSIIRSRGDKYSTRLENLIKSVNWAEDLAVRENCDAVVCLGDFFDKPELTAEEISALKEIKWNILKHYFLIGNHESNVAALNYSSTDTFYNKNGFEIISKPTFVPSLNILFLPYILEENRKKLQEYVVMGNDKPRIIFSHNDVKGIQYGVFKSKEGFDKEDIDNSCDLFLNGHLHNGVQFSEKGINLGNLTGQNFSEDASKYQHCAFILDTETLHLKSFVNPHAFNFYKFQIDTEEDLKRASLKLLLSKNNIVNFKCEESLVEKLKLIVSTDKDIISHRITIFKNDLKVEEGKEQVLHTVDHLEQFSNFVLDTLGASEVLKEELVIICKGN